MLSTSKPDVNPKQNFMFFTIQKVKQYYQKSADILKYVWHQSDLQFLL